MSAKRPAALEFLSGLFSGIGLILLTWLATVLTLSTFQNYLPHHPSDGPHRIAVLWAVLALGLGFLLFQYGVRHKRQSSFIAGLVTAGALFLLLDAACWSFTFGVILPTQSSLKAEWQVCRAWWSCRETTIPGSPRKRPSKWVDLVKKDGKTVDAHYYANEGHGFEKRKKTRSTRSAALSSGSTNI
jgi:hypothetical protein